MRITVILASSPQPTALAAAGKTVEQQRAILTFFMVALALYHGKSIPNALRLATESFKAGGSPSYGKPTLVALQSKKPTPSFSIKLEDFDKKHAKLAKLLMRAADKESRAYQEVSRLAQLTGNQEVMKAWLPKAVAPDPAQSRTKEYKTALTRFLKDKCIELVRKGKTLPTVIGELNSHLTRKEFRVPKITGLSINDLGELLVNGEPLVAHKGGPVTIWVLRNSKLVKPTRKGGKEQYLFGYQPKNGVSTQKAYRLSSVQKAVEKKWKAVSALGKGLPRLYKAWMRELSAGHAIGAVLHFAYLTSARIGGSSATSFGVTTLQCRHVKIKGNQVLVSYTGKGQAGKADAVQEHKLLRNKETALLIDYIKERVETGAAGDLLFTDDGTALSNTEVNGFIQKYVPSASVHKFRHLRGTAVAERVLADLVPKRGTSQNQAEAMFKEAMEEVGKVLGHYNIRGDSIKISPMTAIKSYCEPTILSSWFVNHGFDVPDFIPTRLAA